MRKTTKRLFSILMAAILCVSMMFCMTGCGDKPEDAIVEMFDSYVASITGEDIDAYMGCIDSGSADINIESIKAAMESVFASYDLKASVCILDINELNEEAGTATATVTIEYLNNGDNAYIDNRVTGVYTLVNKDGKWLITNSVMQSVEYIDGVPVSDSDLTYTVPDEPASDADVSGGDIVDGNDALAVEPDLNGAVG